VQVPIYAEVTATSAPVVVAVQPIARGDVFTAAHIELRAVDYTPKATDRRAVVDSVEKLIGMEARQAIQAGDVVFTDQVQAPVLVKRGEVVTVSSQAGGIRIRTTARARRDGARGELVEVESLETRERFDARVVGLRETAVFALTRPTTAEPLERFDTARR
jgi:flagella basal body P-ring formation protein FlgA